MVDSELSRHGDANELAEYKALCFRNEKIIN